MALIVTYLDHGAECVDEIYTRIGVERFVRRHGVACLIDVKGKLPFVRQHNVGATVDWLDRMGGGTYEFDIDAIDEMRNEEQIELIADAYWAKFYSTN